MTNVVTNAVTKIETINMRLSDLIQHGDLSVPQQLTAAKKTLHQVAQDDLLFRSVTVVDWLALWSKQSNQPWQELLAPFVLKACACAVDARYETASERNDYGYEFDSEQVDSMCQFAPLLLQALPHITDVPSLIFGMQDKLFDAANTYTAVTCLLRVLRGKDCTDYNAKVLKVALGDVLPDNDVLATFLEVHEAETCIWPLSVLHVLFTRALTDARFTNDSAAYLKLAFWAYASGRVQVERLHAQMDTPPLSYKRKGHQRYLSVLQHAEDNAFWRYLTIPFYNLAMLRATPDVVGQSLRTLACSALKTMSYHERTTLLTIHATAPDESVDDESTNDLRGLLFTQGVITDTHMSKADLWRHVMPEWRTQAPAWDALGLTGAAWIAAGRELETLYAPGTLPDIHVFLA